MAGQQIVSNSQSWSLNKTEVGFNLEKNVKTIGNTEDAVWKVHIPKILPLVKRDFPKEAVEPLTSSLFINEKSCKPVVQKSVKSRNYIEVKHPANCSFMYKHKKHGTKIDVEVLNGNVDNLRVSNTVDQSFSSSGD